MAAPELLAALSLPGIPGRESKTKILPRNPTTGLAAIVRSEDGIRGQALNGQKEPHTFYIPFHPGFSSPVILVDRVIDELRIAGGGNTDWTGVATAGFNGTFRDHATRSWGDYTIPWISLDLEGNNTILDPEELLDKAQKLHTKDHRRPIVRVGEDGQVITSKLATWREQMAVLPKHRAQIYAETLDNLGRTLDDENSVTVVGNTAAFAGGVAQMNAEAVRLITDYNEEVPQRRAKGEDVREIDLRWIVADSPHVDYDIARSIASNFGITVDIEDTAVQQYFMNKYGDTDENGNKFINTFRLTKDRHNALQNQAQPGYEYTNLDDWYYHAWAKTQAKERYKPVIEKLVKDGKKVVLKWEDQQMFAVGKYIQEYFPKDKYPEIYYNERLHIHVFAELAKNPETPQGAIAASIIKDLEGGDAYMSHMARPEDPTEFLFQDGHGDVHPTIRDITVWAPPSMDTTTGNRTKMHPEKEAVVRAENFAFLEQTGQSTEYFDLDGIVQTNRWDRSKKLYKGMHAYALHLREQMDKGRPLDEILQFKSVGMTPNDDPEGKLINTAYMLGLHPELRGRPEYTDFMQWVDDSDPKILKSKNPEDMAKEPKVKDKTRFLPEDWMVIQLLNTLAQENPALKKKIEMYRFTYDKNDDLNRNAVESSSVAFFHGSDAEAGEDNLTGHMSQGRFGWCADAGGAPNQIKPGITGNLFKPSNYLAVASEMTDFYENIYLNKDLLRSFREGVAANIMERYTTPYNVVKVLGMSAMLAHEGPGNFKQKVMGYMETHDGRRPFVHELIGPYVPQSEELATYDEKVVTHPERVIYTAPHSKAEANAN